MLSLINWCIDIIETKEKHYKNDCFYILMALHNLPKVLLKTDANLYVTVSFNSISESEAIRIAYSYLSKVKNDRLKNLALEHWLV